MNKSGIYKIENLLNGKMYIGSAIDLKARRRKHFSNLRLNNHDNKHLQASYNKYGQDNFLFIIIELVEDFNLLIEREQYHMNNNKDKLYNHRLEAQSNLGFKHTDESKAKISMAHKGRYVSEQTREKLRQVNKGKIISLETKIKMSKAQRGKRMSQESIERSRAARKGVPRSEETKRKLSEAHMGKKVSEATKEKIRLGHLGRTQSLEHKLNRAKSQYKEVAKIDITTNQIIEIYESVSAAAKDTGVTPGCISACFSGKQKTSGGFKWELINSE